MATLVNSGLVKADGSGSNYGAVNMTQGGYVTNLSTGRIVATAENAVYITQFIIEATVLNAGTIASDAKAGVFLLAPGVVSNQSGGTITERHRRLHGELAGLTVDNLGTIQGGNFGVDLVEGGQVTNGLGGVIGPCPRKRPSTPRVLPPAW